MKRLLLLISVVFAFNSTFAQQVGTSKSINFNALEKKVAKSNADIENPKKNIKDATWIARAELMIEVYNSQILKAYSGMSTDNFNLIVGKPNEQGNDDIDGVSTDKYIMDRVTFFFQEGILVFWEVTKPIVENPLDLAYESILKAKELDVKGKKTKKITENLTLINKLFVDNALNFYYLKNYTKACIDFQKSITISQSPEINKIDTVIYYYAALSAQLAKDYKTAIDLYSLALDKYNYSPNGDIHFKIYACFRDMGEEDKGIVYLEKGLVQYPQNTDIVFSLINCYINKGDDPSKIITYIDKALVSDPNNHSLIFAKATLYDKLEQSDKAIETYLKLIEIKPDYFDAYYNLGAVYYNKGVSLEKEALKLPVSKEKEYNEFILQANSEYKKSIPYMVKAFELSPNSKDAIEALMNLYFRFRNESEDMMNNYKKYKELLDSVK